MRSMTFSSIWMPEDQLDFPVLYTNAKAGIALTDPEGQARFGAPVRDHPERHSRPVVGSASPSAVLVTNLDYNDYVGRLAVGKVWRYLTPWARSGSPQARDAGQQGHPEPGLYLKG